MMRLGLRNNWFKFRSLGESPIVLKDSIERILDSIKGNLKKISTSNRLDLETLGCWPITPKISPPDAHSHPHGKPTSLYFTPSKMLEIVWAFVCMNECNGGARDWAYASIYPHLSLSWWRGFCVMFPRLRESFLGGWTSVAPSHLSYFVRHLAAWPYKDSLIF